MTTISFKKPLVSLLIGAIIYTPTFTFAQIAAQTTTPVVQPTAPIAQTPIAQTPIAQTPTATFNSSAPSLSTPNPEMPSFSEFAPLPYNDPITKLDLVPAKDVFTPQIGPNNSFKGLVQNADGSIVSILGPGSTINAGGQVLSAKGEVIGTAVNNLGMGSDGFGGLMARPIFDNTNNILGYSLADANGSVIGTTLTNGGDGVIGQTIASAGGMLLGSSNTATPINIGMIEQLKSLESLSPEALQALGPSLETLKQYGDQIKSLSGAIPSLTSISSIGQIANLDGLGGVTDASGLFGQGLVGPFVGSYAQAIAIGAAKQSTLESFRQQAVSEMKKIYNKLSDIYVYLTTGRGETGTGILGTMAKIAKADREMQEQTMMNKAAFDNVRTAEQAYANQYTKAIPNPLACLELANNSTRNGGGGGAGKRATTAKANVEAELNRKLVNGAQPTALAHTTEIFKRAGKDYCSAQDALYPDGTKREAFTCTKEGEMPDADARVQSVFAPAYKYTDSAQAATKNRLTFDAEGTNSANSSGKEYQAAKDAAGNIYAAFQPNFLPKEIEATPLGKTYLAKAKVLQARSSTAENAIISILSTRVAAKSGDPEYDAIKEGWETKSAEGYNSPYDAYVAIFGQAAAPKVPSLADILRLEAYRRYFDTSENSWGNQIAQLSDPGDLSREQLRIGSAELLMLYQIHNNLEIQNTMLSSLVAQSINPITKADLEALEATAKTSKK